MLHDGKTKLNANFPYYLSESILFHQNYLNTPDIFSQIIHWWFKPSPDFITVVAIFQPCFLHIGRSNYPNLGRQVELIKDHNHISFSWKRMHLRPALYTHYSLLSMYFCVPGGHEIAYYVNNNEMLLEFLLGRCSIL